MFVGAVFFPLLSATIAGLFGRWIGDKAAQAVTITCMKAACVSHGEDR